MTTRRKFLKQSLLATGAAALPLGSVAAQSHATAEKQPKYRLPYKNTYWKDPLVAENEFRMMKPEVIPHGGFEEARKILPEPSWEGHQGEIDMYWKAWEIGVGNIKDPEPDSGFVCSYFDTAYNGNIFMWDSTFITLFARYGNRFFPFQRTLDNFYAKQHPDGFICREIMADGADCFERYDPTSTGPNIIPWSEVVYYKQFGDIDRLHKIFPVLCSYYKWLKTNRTWRNGTYWSSGWGTGMDNMPRVQPQYNTIFSHGHMIWLDTCLQQIFIGNLLLEIGFYIERWQEIEEFEDEARELAAYINANMWDEKEQFLFDQYRDGSLSKTKGMYAYWALLTDVLPKERVEALVRELQNKETFNRFFMIPSLAANNEKYKDNGRYWQGGVFSGATYMILEGLMKHGYRQLAFDIALNHYNNVFKVFQDTGTVWEYYAPEAAEPGFLSRPDFVGWTGIPPISILIEYLFGIRTNVFEKKMTIDVNLTDAYSLKRYPYGKEGLVDISVKKRADAGREPQLEITSNVDFELLVRWGEKEKKVAVTAGSHTF